LFLFYFLAVVAIWFGLQSLFSGLRYASYVRRETAKRLPDFTPFVSVIAPSRGLEPGLEENVLALLEQDYPSFEIVFVFDKTSDPAVKAVADLQRECPHVNTSTVIAGPATDSGQKVHNLSVATANVSSKCEVLVFVDTDARPGSNWLRRLVAPLIDAELGASSGYRWFVPVEGGLTSRLRSVWNASVASALGADRSKNFCWGGSTAIRKSLFDKLEIRKRWRGSVSDDFTVTRVLREANLPIHFTPACLVPSVGDCDFHELMEFTTRQIKITRVYAPHLWKPVLLGGFLFTITFFGGIALLLWRIATGQPYFSLLALLLLIFILGAVKSFSRWRAVRIPLAGYRRELNRDLLAHIFLWPFTSLLYLYNAIAAAFSQRIAWRGITYELKSPTEAVIISRDMSDG
jgi:ceramide glucosyltransferase